MTATKRREWQSLEFELRETNAKMLVKPYELYILNVTKYCGIDVDELSKYNNVGLV